MSNNAKVKRKMYNVRFYRKKKHVHISFDMHSKFLVSLGREMEVFEDLSWSNCLHFCTVGLFDHVHARVLCFEFQHVIKNK